MLRVSVRRSLVRRKVKKVGAVCYVNSCAGALLERKRSRVSCTLLARKKSARVRRCRSLFPPPTSGGKRRRRRTRSPLFCTGRAPGASSITDEHAHSHDPSSTSRNPIITPRACAPIGARFRLIGSTPKRTTDCPRLPAKPKGPEAPHEHGPFQTWRKRSPPRPQRRHWPGTRTSRAASSCRALCPRRWPLKSCSPTSSRCARPSCSALGCTAVRLP